MQFFNRQRAVEYALRWALGRNPMFPDYSGHGHGGDCTNFVSQAMLAGGWTTVTGWRADRTAWWFETERAWRRSMVDHPARAFLPCLAPDGEFVHTT